MKAFIYYNLHTGKWSVKALEGQFKGLVIGHADGIKLSSPVARVNEKGRQRVLQTGTKNVHAGIVGHVLTMENFKPIKGRYFPYMKSIVELHGQPITYNPYKYSTFICKETGSEYNSSTFAFMKNKQVTVI